MYVYNGFSVLKKEKRILEKYDKRQYSEYIIKVK